MKKILCLCDDGQVRSVAMAQILRERGHFAVAGSYHMYNKMTWKDFYLIEGKCQLTFMNCFDKLIFMQERGGKHFIGKLS
jgi:hypothetical protein